MAQDDYAILVGISEYANNNFPSLNGPQNDIDLVTSWLTAVDGGAVPPANIRALVTANPVDNPKPLDLGPTAAHYLAEFKRVALSEGGQGWAQRPGRLYLYMCQATASPNVKMMVPERP